MSEDRYQNLRSELAHGDEAEANNIVELAEPEKDRALVASLLQQSGIATPSPDTASDVVPKPNEGTPVQPKPWLTIAGLKLRREPAMFISVLALLVAIVLPLSLHSYFSGTKELHANYIIDVSGDVPEASMSATPEIAKVPGKNIRKLSMDSRFQVYLRPSDPVHNEVIVHAFVRKEKTLQPWDVSLDRSQSGVFQLRGRVRELPLLSPGHWELFFAVGYRDRLPTREHLIRMLNEGMQEGQRPGWQLLHGEVEILQ